MTSFDRPDSMVLLVHDEAPPLSRSRKIVFFFPSFASTEATAPLGILAVSTPLIEAGLLDPDGLKAAVTELENGSYSEDPWSKLVEVITLDQAARAFLP